MKFQKYNIKKKNVRRSKKKKEDKKNVRHHLQYF